VVTDQPYEKALADFLVAARPPGGRRLIFFP